MYNSEDMTETNIVTSIATPNIAFIKYWGKRDYTGLNTPNNSSISMTLDETVKTTTSVFFSSKIKKDTIFINGVEDSILAKEVSEKSRYMNAILNKMRSLSKINYHALIVSENNFPSGAGIASSASGAAALVIALNEALSLKMNTKELSIMARQISGSACRSLYGGIVKWHKGSRDDGTDSYAEQIFKKEHWKELIDIIAIVDSGTKKISSSIGHEATVKTSTLYKERPAFAERNIEEIEKAIKNKDIDLLSRIIMKDSNNMHATMLDTWPPIMYLNDSSKEIIYNIHELNDSQKNEKYIAGYTFDAGPNAHIITTEEHRDEVLDSLKGVKGIKKILESHQGAGPRILSKDESLLNESTLTPKKMK
jgi:diphosphomevalonate decarboxylase